MALLGGMLAVWGMVTVGWKNTSGLKGGFVSDGPYRFTRNPQYVGDIVFFIGVGVIANSVFLWIAHLLLALVFVALVHESELARNDPHPEAPHLPISYDSGPPRSVIRFRMLHASSASALCPPGVRARRPVPMIDLYLKKAFSTRACRW